MFVFRFVCFFIYVCFCIRNEVGFRYFCFFVCLYTQVYIFVFVFLFIKVFIYICIGFNICAICRKMHY